MRGVAAAVLAFEAVVFLLAVPVAITLGGVSASVAVPVGVALAVGCVLVAGMLRRPWGYAAGWLVQAAAVLLGFVVPAMFLLGGVFGILWYLALRLGRQVEAAKAARAAAG